jgi:methyltransferase (TIGR00027 family)
MSATAEYMALFRALESSAPAPTRLFDDPYACRFLRPSLRVALGIGRSRACRPFVLGVLDTLWPGARTSGIARTRFIDDALLAAARDQKLGQVVLLGAGFDCRAHRELLRPAPVFLEVDRPEIQARKRRLLRDRAGDGVRYAPCDFEAGSVAESLRKAGFRPDQPSFFLWEGVTNYLSPGAVDDVLGFVSSTAPGSVLLFTYVDRRILEQPGGYAGSRMLRWILGRSRESWTFGIAPAEVGSFLRERRLRLVCDTGSVEYRARYLGESSACSRGYEFYRAAIATIPDSAGLARDDGRSRDAQGQS